MKLTGGQNQEASTFTHNASLHTQLLEVNEWLLLLEMKNTYNLCGEKEKHHIRFGFWCLASLYLALSIA